MTEDRHGNDLIVAVKLDTPDTDRGAAVKDAHVCRRKANCPTRVGDQHDVIIIGRDAGIDQSGCCVIIFEFHRDLAVAHDVCEIRQLVSAHCTCRSREYDLQIIPVFLITINRHDGGDRYTDRNRQDVDNRFAF